jgi:Leucine-rich repeat (LRR) protein
VKLETIDVSDNKLTEISDSVCQLVSLKELMVRRAMPRAAMCSSAVLQVDGNSLTDIPASLGRLTPLLRRVQIKPGALASSSVHSIDVLSAQEIKRCLLNCLA